MRHLVLFPLAVEQLGTELVFAVKERLHEK
jgi:hypothetical protein